MARRIEVEIVGDSRSVERAFAKSARSATVFESRMKGVSRGLSGAFKTGAAAVGIGLSFDAAIRGLERSLSAAEDLNKEASKTRTVFGAAARSVEDWAKTTADAFGINEAEALRAASNFGILFNTLHKGRDTSAEMSKQLVQVAADLASFFHISASDVLTKLLRGLYGQARGIKVLGINMTNARVTAEAYSDGIAVVGSKLTESQKVQARYNIILRDALPAQGNAVRHAHDWANVQARLNAVIEDTFAAIGNKLLPVFRDFADRFEAWLSDAGNQKKIVGDVTLAVNLLGDAAQIAADGMEALDFATQQFNKHAPSLVQYLTKTDLFQQMKDFARTVKYVASGHLLKPGQFLPPTPPGPPGKGIPSIAGGIGAGAAAIAGVAATLRKPGATTQFIHHDRRIDTAKQALQRYAFFDARIARQLDRVQDLGLRKQLVRLGQIAAEVKARLAVTKDVTRRLTLEDKLLEIYRQQKSVQQDITDQIKEANQALKDRAEAIKSAILDRLQRKQTDVENKRALEDARKQLRLALALGGPHGILVARRAVSDALMAQRIAAAERARPTLTRGGQFALGNIITINIHGVTDPDQVARQVIAAMNRRGRRTTSQSRGPQAGAPAGAH